MFKFLQDIKVLKLEVEELFCEFNDDHVITGFFSRRRTLQKRVHDLEIIVDKLLGNFKLEANEVAAIPEQVIEEVPSTWEIAKKCTHAKKQEAKKKAEAKSSK